MIVESLSNGKIQIDITEESPSISIYTDCPVVTEQIQSDWNQANSALLDYIKNKPDLTVYETITGAASKYELIGVAAGLMSSHLSAFNHDNIALGATAYGWGNHASAGYQLLSSLSNDIATDAASIVKYPTVKAIKDYADNLVIGLVDDRGNYDPTITGAFPVSGGSGTGGAILKGDIWFISAAGTITDGSGTPHLVGIGDSLRALADTPGQTFSNWDFLGTAFGYVPENVANKVTSIGAGSTDTEYPTAKLLYDQLAGKQAAATNLTSLSGLTFASTSFVKMTGAGTFGLDTNVYLTAESDPVFGAWLATPPNVSIFTNDAGYLTAESDTLATVTGRGDGSTTTACIFSTSLQTPLLIGGSAIDSKITYKSTTGAGTAAGIAHQFTGGTDGGTVAMTILNNGNIGIGVVNPSYQLYLSESLYVSKHIYIGYGYSLRCNNLYAESNTNMIIGWAFNWTGAGKTMTLKGWGQDGSGTDGAGGNIIIQSGQATGTGSSDIIMSTVTAGTTGTTIRTATEKVRITGAGNVSIGIGASPTAYLHIKAGTATAGTAPIKLTAGVKLTTPEIGAIEFADNKFYVTCVGTQRAIDRTSDVIVATTTVSDTTTETTIYTGIIGANDLKVGNILKLHADGVITTATASDDITVKIYLGLTEVLSFKPVLGKVTDAHWHMDGNMTVRTVGAGGTMAFHLDMDINGNLTEEIGTGSVDTTITEDYTVKVIWDNAKAGNSISIYQGYTEFKN